MSAFDPKRTSAAQKLIGQGRFGGEPFSELEMPVRRLLVAFCLQKKEQNCNLSEDRAAAVGGPPSSAPQLAANRPSRSTRSPNCCGPRHSLVKLARPRGNAPLPLFRSHSPTALHSCSELPRNLVLAQALADTAAPRLPTHPASQGKRRSCCEPRRSQAEAAALPDTAALPRLLYQLRPVDWRTVNVHQCNRRAALWLVRSASTRPHDHSMSPKKWHS